MWSSTIYNDDQEEKLMKRPKCSRCGEHIQEDECIETPDNELICEECEFEHGRELWLEFGREYFKRRIEDEVN